eukprot:NODE_11_length_54881_cov_1.430718.p10 type:complete len:533 gc:universal NODE_11_length_54881_cov_1.430718:10224-11822(+)
MIFNKLYRLKDIFTPLPLEFQTWIVEQTRKYHAILIIAHAVSVILLTIFDIISKKIEFQYPFRLAYLAIDLFLLGMFKTKFVKHIDVFIMFGLSFVIILARINDVYSYNRSPQDNDSMDITSYIIIHAATTLPHFRQWYYCFFIPIVFLISFPVSRACFAPQLDFFNNGSAVIYVQALLICYGAVTAHYIKFELMVRSYIADHNLGKQQSTFTEPSSLTSKALDISLAEQTESNTAAIDTENPTIEKELQSDDSVKKSQTESNFNTKERIPGAERERRPSKKNIEILKRHVTTVKQISKNALISKKFHDPNWESKCKFIDFRDTLRVLRRSLPLASFAATVGAVVQFSIGSQTLASVLLIIFMQGVTFLLFGALIFVIIKTLKIQFPKRTEKDNISNMPVDLTIYKKNNTLEALIFAVSVIAINCFMISFNTFGNQQEVFATYIDCVTTFRMRRSSLLFFTLTMLTEGIVLYATFKSSFPALSSAYMEIVKALAFGAVEGVIIGYYLIYLRRTLFEKNAKLDTASSQSNSNV